MREILRIRKRFLPFVFQPRVLEHKGKSLRSAFSDNAQLLVRKFTWVRMLFLVSRPTGRLTVRLPLKSSPQFPEENNSPLRFYPMFTGSVRLQHAKSAMFTRVRTGVRLGERIYLLLS